MSGTIQDVVANIQTTLKALTGIRYAPDYPPELVPLPMTSIAYPASGVISAQSAGWFKELWTVNIDLIIPGAKDLTRELTTLNPYLRSVPNEIMSDPTFGGNASTFDSINVAFISYEVSGILNRGYRFAISGIKIEPVIT